MSQDRSDDRDEIASAESPTQALGHEAATPAPGLDARETDLEIGQVLGGRYQVRAFLGRGGMGEVWRAFDLKLRVEVALKALRSTLATDATRLELLRQEVRAAREVTSPNVCRIYDLVELDGSELVSMEYVDGQTLLEVMRKKAPMDPPEAQEIASQFLAGLEAIHQAGLVHRDVKPENVMVTRTGRVVLMDFGLARSSAEGAGTVSGTPAYMAPEQTRGEADARSDLFSAGVILAEMVSPAGVRDFESRQSVWSGIRAEPVEVPDSPWSPVVKKAVAKDSDERFQTAHELTRALEEVAFRVHDETGLEPYPGLASFDEGDAEYFFGREAEVETVWTRLQSAQLLGVIGASGSGKSSFLGAGLIPARPDGWAVTLCTPGGAAIASLRRAIVPEIEGDTEAVQQLAEGGDEALVDAFEVWRKQHDEALLIVDQFEELFTQNSDEEQARCAEVLGRVALDVDVHVLLSMRDDFLIRCHEHEALTPIFSELTPLKAPIGGALRRAVVQPALRCGYRFEDEELADEILAEVEGERGALPLLAFALARLWEKRDRENGLISRQAYRDIGGVGGALAQHAESLMERLGPERHPIVRELFRNLVTAQGTRAARDVDELLSVFEIRTPSQSSRARRPQAGIQPLSSRASDGPEGRRESRDPPTNERRGDLDAIPGTPGDPSTRSLRSLAQDDRRTDRRHTASEVLRALVDARLLTSYEVPSADGPGRQRVEVIHESLLRTWPRLVRWQAQDAEGALLRDQLRQAAAVWDERGRSDDLLWSGTAFREYQVWRERYPGGLTDLEEAFASAMTSLASRRRRRRRLAVVAAGFVLMTVLAVVTTLWRRSVAETRRAEAGKLLALGQSELESDTTVALAYARASLELADTPEARRFAVEVLWRGPVARILPVKRMAREAGLTHDPSPHSQFAISLDGRWLATATVSHRQVLLFPRDGGLPRALPRQPDGNVRVLAFGPRSEVLVTGGTGSSMRFWSLPELEEIRSVDLGGLGSIGWGGGDRLLTSTRVDEAGRERVRRFWPLPEGEPEVLENSTFPRGPFDIDPSGTVVANSRDRSVLVSPLKPSGPSKERVVGDAGDLVQDVAFAPGGDLVASVDRSGEIRVWSVSGDSTAPLHVFHGPRYEGIQTTFDPTGRYVTQAGPNMIFLLWDLESPPGTEARVVQRGVPSAGSKCEFDAQGHWLVTAIEDEMIELWTLETPWVRTFRDVSSTIWSMAFTDDSRWLATCPFDQQVDLWPLNAAYGSPRKLVPPEPCIFLATHPARQDVLVGTTLGDVLLYPISGASPRKLPEGFGGAMVGAVAFDAQGRRVVAGPYAGGRGIVDPTQRVVRTWELESGTERVYSIAHLTDEDWDHTTLGFAHDGTLYATLGKGGRVMRLTLPPDPSGEVSAETVVAAGSAVQILSKDGRFLVVHASETEGSHNFRFEELLLFDLVEGTSRRITTHGARLTKVTQIDPTGRILVTGDIDGVVRAGPVTGEEPHLLLGHAGSITSLAISPDGGWIASATEESVRLWPMPDVTRPPLHTLPHDELMAKLDALTNLRAVRDETSATGWTLEVGPFQGWETVSEW